MKDGKIMKKKTKNSIPFVFKLFIGIVVLIGMFVVAMIFGAAETTLKDVWLALTSNRKSDTILMLREIRFPREIAAIIVGAALSVSGAIMQGLTRNPLADPGLLGLSAGANAALALTLAFIPSANYIWITISCFIGAAIGTGMVFGLGALQKGGFELF